MKKDIIGINEFVRRHTLNSRFSCFDGSFEDVIKIAEQYLDKKRKGYRDGVWELDVPPEGFLSSVVKLKEGDILVGKYEARKEGETPRKHTGVKSIGKSKLPAKAVTLILYSHDVLAENNEQSTDCELELISINARCTLEAEPISPGTLMANHFCIDGGTSTRMTDAEFVKALKISTEYWSDKAMIEPDNAG